MSEEKMKILEMIEKNIITPAEGLNLLETLNEVDVASETRNIAPEKVEDTLEDAVDEESLSEEAEEILRVKVDEIKSKAETLKDKIKIDIKGNGEKFKKEFDKEEFKREMKSLGGNLKKEMKSFQKDAKSLRREMSKFGKDAAVFSQGVVNDVLESVRAVDSDEFQKKYDEGDYLTDEDKEVRNFNITQEFSLNCDGKKEVSIKVISTDVNIITEEREDILVKYINYTENDENNFKVIVEENSKAIRISEKKEKNGNFLFGISFSDSGGKELLIRLPRKYKESLSVKTISGDLKLNYLDIDSFRFSSVSGDMSADIIYSVNSLVKTTSGDCEIGLFRGNMMFSAVSGDINIKYKQLDGDFTMKSVSGDAEIELPKNSEFEVTGKTVSGDIECDFPLTIIGAIKRGILRGQVGSDEYAISTTTTSGDVNISRY